MYGAWLYENKIRALFVTDTVVGNKLLIGNSEYSYN